MIAPPHGLNWHFGWWLVLSAFVTGALLGLFFHRDTFLGGYDSFRRRLLRLGHIAQAALGMMKVLYGLSPWPVPASPQDQVAGWSFVVGGVSMPLVCFLTAWKQPFRHLFVVPVVALIVAVAATLRGIP